jgi:hypothetical protein
MITGVLLHLVLHWRWIISMTGRMLSKPVRASRPVRTETVPEVVWIKSGRRKMNRRDFLRLSGVAMVGAGLGVLGYRAIGTVGPIDAVQEAQQDRVVSPAVDRPSLQEAETEELQLLPTPTRQVPPPAAPTEAPQQACVAWSTILTRDGAGVTWTPTATASATSPSLDPGAVAERTPDRTNHPTSANLHPGLDKSPVP